MKKSAVWQHFCQTTDGEGTRKAMCEICREQLSYAKSGSTSNLLNHLKNRHSLTALKDATESQDQVPLPVKQLKLDFRAMTPGRQEHISELITNFIVGDMRPIATVEGENFRALMSYIEPNYSIPSRRTMTRRIDQLFEVSKEKLKARLSGVQYMSLTFDAWTSINMESFMGVTAHFIDNEMKLQSCLLSCKLLDERHKSENIVSWIEEILQEYNIDPSRVTCAVSDNASNMIAAKNIFASKHGWYSLGCTAHLLQLCINEGLKIPAIDDCLAVARKLVAHFKRSELATTLLKKKCDEMTVEFKKLIMEVKTRWNSSYFMIARLIEMQWPLIATVNEQSQSAASLIPQQSQWKMMEQLTKILEPFVEATEMLGSQTQVTISLINPYIKSLKRHVAKMSEVYEGSEAIVALCERLAQQLNSRFPVTATDKAISYKATAVDPRYKLKGLTLVESIKLRSSMEMELIALQDRSPTGVANPPVTSSPAAPRSSLTSLVQMMYASSDSDSCSDKECNTIHDELEAYFSERRAVEDQDPLEWWSNKRDSYPNILKLVSKYMCIPATSTPSERVFSTAGNTATKLRSCLTGTHVEALVFLKCNE